MHIDPNKLELVRDMIDTDVVDICVANGFERNEARRIIACKLGYLLECFRIDSWYVAASISLEDERIASGLFDEVCMQRAAEFYSASFTRQICVSANAETAETAMICLLIDEFTDLSFDEATLNNVMPYALRPSLGDLHFTLCDYLEQERWFGIVHQYGRAIDNHEIRCVAGHKEYKD